MAAYEAAGRDGGSQRENGSAARESRGDGWTPPVARIERGADGRVRIRVGGGARRDGAGGDVPRPGG